MTMQPQFDEIGDAIRDSKALVAKTSDNLIFAGAKLAQLAEEALTMETAKAKLEIQNALQAKEIEALKKLIPNPTPPKNPLIFDFKDLDWNKLFSDGDTSPVTFAPKERFQVIPGGLNFIWVANQPYYTMRTELGIRESPGPRDPVEKPSNALRAPVGSKRKYLYEFTIPNSYNLIDEERDHKRNLWQCHQSGGSIPPLALEIRNGDFHLVRLNSTKLFDVPIIKGIRNVLKVEVLWKADASGFVECDFNGQKFSYNGPTCYPVSDGVQNKCGSYQPGAKNGDFPTGYRMEYPMHRWAIGSEENTWEDFA